MNLATRVALWVFLILFGLPALILFWITCAAFIVGFTNGVTGQ